MNTTQTLIHKDLIGEGRPALAAEFSEAIAASNPYKARTIAKLCGTCPQVLREAFGF